ncbi:hypothetical protein ZWY2020_029187 [Hordeum vulgare]|nr:hypothetical protein ZWY2020_029187 [Hordeum vulgare]
MASGERGPLATRSGMWVEAEGEVWRGKDDDQKKSQPHVRSCPCDHWETHGGRRKVEIGFGACRALRRQAWTEWGKGESSGTSASGCHSL